MGPAGKEQQGGLDAGAQLAEGRDGAVPPVPPPQHPLRSRHPFALARAFCASGFA